MNEPEVIWCGHLSIAVLTTTNPWVRPPGTYHAIDWAAVDDPCFRPGAPRPDLRTLCGRTVEWYESIVPLAWGRHFGMHGCKACERVWAARESVDLGALQVVA